MTLTKKLAVTAVLTALVGSAVFAVPASAGCTSTFSGNGGYACTGN